MVSGHVEGGGGVTTVEHEVVASSERGERCKAHSQPKGQAGSGWRGREWSEGDDGAGVWVGEVGEVG